MQNDQFAERKIPYFDRNTTNVIKGIALIMMFVHHFFTFPEWWGEGISYPLIERLAPYFCAPLKLCAIVFCFITGYLYYYNPNKTFRYTAKKITDILIAYWIVLFLFVLIAVICTDYQYTVRGLLMECFALERPTMIFCWYVYFYMASMLILPLIVKIMSKNIHLDLLLSLIVVPLILKISLALVKNPSFSEIAGSLMAYFPCLLTGYICANYGLFEKIGKLNSKMIRNKVLKVLNVIIWVLVAFAVPMGRYFLPELIISFSGSLGLTFLISMDVLYTPIFVFALVHIYQMTRWKAVDRILIPIGKCSLLMWFISCIFYNNCKAVFQPVLYFPHNPVAVTVWGLLLCFVPSYFLNIGVQKIQRLKNKRLFRNG